MLQEVLQSVYEYETLQALLEKLRVTSEKAKSLERKNQDKCEVRITITLSETQRYRDTAGHPTHHHTDVQQLKVNLR